MGKPADKYDPIYGSSRKKKREFQSIQNVLKGTLKKFGLENEISKHRFVLHWQEIVGAELAKKTRPECIRHKTLVIRVQNSIWAQELSFQKDIILKRLKYFLGEDDVVDDVHFYTGTID